MCCLLNICEHTDVCTDTALSDRWGQKSHFGKPLNCTLHLPVGNAIFLECYTSAHSMFASLFSLLLLLLVGRLGDVTVKTVAQLCGGPTWHFEGYYLTVEKGPWGQGRGGVPAKFLPPIIYREQGKHSYGAVVKCTRNGSFTRTLQGSAQPRVFKCVFVSAPWGGTSFFSRKSSQLHKPVRPHDRTGDWWRCTVTKPTYIHQTS